MSNVQELQAKIKDLESQLANLKLKHVREKIETMSSEVKDSNPYR